MDKLYIKIGIFGIFLISFFNLFAIDNNENNTYINIDEFKLNNLTNNFNMNYNLNDNYNEQMNNTYLVQNNQLYDEYWELDDVIEVDKLVQEYIVNDFDEMKLLDVFETPEEYVTGVDLFGKTKIINKNEISKLNIKTINILDNFDKNKINEITLKPKLYNLKNEILNLNKSNNNESTIKIISEYIVDKFGNKINKNDLNISQLKPGIYKTEIEYFEILSESKSKFKTYENFYYNGLVSVNTEKSLYTPNELVKIYFVVLNSGGYLTSGAKIKLNIQTPSNVTHEFFEYDIIETTSKGIYYLEYLPFEIGEFNLEINVELSDIVIYFSTYFNVVLDSEIAFEIIREVPMTIDPWAGSYQSKIKIVPKNKSIIYNYTEVIPYEFTLIKYDVDEIEFKNNKILLKWFNLSGDNNFSYSSQVPLISPNLFEIGKSYINYTKYTINNLSINITNRIFIENRSWYLAIDPVAVSCNSQSPCFCSSGCLVDDVGDGTIDSCVDGNKEKEYIKDIIVEDLENEYFGKGDKVQISIVYNCKINTPEKNDIRLFYKDETTSWSDSDFINMTNCQEEGIGIITTELFLNNYSGLHHVRATITRNDVNNVVCPSVNRYDVDDLEFLVLEKKVPKVNTTFFSINNNLNISSNVTLIHGDKIKFLSVWDIDVVNGIIFHNANSSFINISSVPIIDTLEYELDTSNLDEFPSKGVFSIYSFVRNKFFININNYSNILNLTIY
ncbi:MAG: hypothetical protein HRU03_08870, partial [Nanoarchaeales archaeon]|nr:hypothetical protein [Nanoarchaeales archaeon]